MARSFLNIDLSAPKSIYGVEVLMGDGVTFIASHISMSGSKVNLESNKTFSNIDDLTLFVGKGNGVSLSFTGKGVLSKAVSSGAASEKEMIRSILPNVNPIEFYVNHSEANIVSICRRDAVERIVTSLKNSDIFIVGLFVGPGLIGDLKSIINGDSIFHQSGSLTFKGDKIVAVDKELSVRNYSIEGESISSEYIMSYLSGLAFFAGIEGVKEEQVVDLKTEFGEKNKFKKLVAIILVSILVIMLVNFLWYDSLKKDIEKLGSREIELRSVNSQLSLIENEVLEKKQLMKKMNLKESTRFSFYLDQIALTVPKGIQLTDLSINPLQKKVKEDKEINYENNVIEISGRTKKSTIYNEWKREVGQLEWVKNIIVLNYLDTEDSIGEFTLKIEL